MEVEQDTSQFKKLSHSSSFYSTSEALNLISDSGASLFKPPDAAEKRLQKVFSGLYQWVDNLSGLQSLTYIPENLSNQQFWDIFKFLQDKNIVGDISFLPMRYNDAPPFIRCDIHHSTTAFAKEVADGVKPERGFAHGFGKNVGVVFSKAIGEFLERYFLSLYKAGSLLRGSYYSLTEKGYSALNPEELSKFNEEQKNNAPRIRADEKTIFYWEKAKGVSTNKEILIPAQLIYWNYNFNRSGQEPLLAEPNTNGAGGYFTKEGAILSGLYELIQRDAFLIYWLNEITPVKIKPESVPDETFQEILDESKRYDFEVYCLNTTLDSGVPSFVVVVVDSLRKWPYFSLGGGCQADPAKALRRALEEAWSVYNWLRTRPTYALPEDYHPFSDFNLGQDERLRLCADPNMAKHYDFLLNGETKNFKDSLYDYPDKFSSEREELSFLVKRIEGLGRGYEVYYFSSKHEVLDNLGYHSVKVVVPPFVPLYLRENRAPLGAQRLRTVPVKIGFKAAERFNPIPHPFP